MPLSDALNKPVLARDPARQPRGWRAGALTLPELLAPDGVDRRWSHMIQVGDSYLTTLELHGLPPTLSLGWMHDPALGLDAPGTTIHQRITPVDDRIARQILARSEDAALGTLAGDIQAGTHADTAAQQGLEAAAALRRELVAGADRLFQLSVSITLAAASPPELEARVDALRLAAAQQGLILQIARFQQWEGYCGALPLGRAATGSAHDMSGRAVAMGLPVASPGIQRRVGLPIVWGEHPRTGVPVIWDRWSATNPHALIVAESGSGKTYAISGLMAQELALGEDALLILDPKFQEYRSLVTALGGAYITLSARSEYHMNPLELPRLTPERARRVEQLEEDLLTQRIAVVRALIATELKHAGTRLDATDLAALEDAIVRAYLQRGITNDIRTHDRPMPLFGDVQACLDSDMPGLARALTLFTRGIVGALFNHPSNVPVTTPLLAIDLSPLMRARDEVLERLIPIVTMDFFVGAALNRTDGRRSHLVLDEAHALLQSEAGAQSLQTIFRIGRALQFKATVITQSLDDLDSSDQTRVLLENARTKLILGLNRDSRAVARAAGLLGLNEEEQRYLASCRLVRGVGATGLLLADGERTPLLIRLWPDSIHRAVTGRAHERE